MRAFLIGLLWLLFLAEATTAAAGIESRRGRLVSGSGDGQPIRGAFFFPGQARDGSARYGLRCTENLSLYTIHPADPRHLRWSASLDNRRFALHVMREAGVNTIFMSTWGESGTDYWCQWAPMQTAPGSHDELFTVAAEFPLRIMPVIESHADWQLRSEFPGTPGNPAPGLVRQVVDLVRRYLTEPDNNAWPEQWAQVYDREGEPRYAVHLMHVSSDQPGVTHRQFAEGFDHVTTHIEQETGVRVGFLLDVLPPGTFAPGAFRPSAGATGPPLSESAAVLALSPYLPEIWLGTSDESLLLNWKRSFTQAWMDTGIPYLQDMTPGYDARLVFPGSPRFGNNASWREANRQRLVGQPGAGVCFNAWNGYTEGYAAVSTQEFGDVNYRWARDLYGLYGAARPGLMWSVR